MENELGRVGGMIFLGNGGTVWLGLHNIHIWWSSMQK